MKVVAFIVNFFIPGIGTLMVKKFAQGIIQLVLLVLGFTLIFTGIGIIFGAPIVIVTWIWSLVSVVKSTA